MTDRLAPAQKIRYGLLSSQLPYVFFVVLMVACLALTSRRSIGLAVIVVIYVVGALLGIAYSVRAATHPLLDRAIRGPWRYVAVVFLLDIVIGASSLPISDGTDLAHLGMSPLLVLGLLGLVTQTVCLVAALTSFASMPLSGRSRQKLALDVIIVVGAALIVLWYVVIWPALPGHRTSLSPAAVIYVCTMLLSDLASIVGISTVVLLGTVPAVRRPARLMLTSVLGFLSWDLWAIWAHVHPAWAVSATVSQLVAIVPLYLMVAAAVEQCRAAGSSPSAASQAPGIRRPSPLPYLALMVGFAVQIVAAVRHGGLPWFGLVTGGVVMSLGVAMRQLVSLQENYALALADPLTGLANRLHLTMTLGSVLSDNRRSGTLSAVMVIDLNGFKQINDTHGHETGDELLVIFAELLRRVLRRTDVPARWGGDEFVVVLNRIKDSRDAIMAAERVFAAIRDPVVVKGQQILIRASIGIAMSDPELPDVTQEDLLRDADQAMYRAKRIGSPGWQVYSRDWQTGDAEVQCAGAGDQSV